MSTGDETLPPKNPFLASEPISQALRDAVEEAPAEIGPYRVAERIGAGGMGVVYKCEDPSLKRFVAVKVLRRKHSGDDHYRKRFQREAQTIASLSHPAIAHVYGIGEFRHGGDQLLYIAMEHVDGSSIESILEREGRIPPARAVHLARETALGLRAACLKGIIHRDIKPSNLLVGSTGSVKIVDFGLAKEIGSRNSMTDEGIVMGTPHYISPEQGRGRGVDHRSDIYSLGATLYHMLTGRPPFEGNSQVSVIVSHVSDAPRAPHEVHGAIPAAASRVVLRMMAKAQDSRYATYDELIEDLDAVSRGIEPPHDTRIVKAETQPMPRTTGAAWRPRLTRLAWIGAAALVLGMLGAAYAVLHRDAPVDAAVISSWESWYKPRPDGGVLLDMDFGNLPKSRANAESWRRLVITPAAVEPGASAPRPDQGALRWESFEHPFAVGLRFERIDEVQVWVGATSGTFDLGIAIVDPDGAQRRFILFRLRPAEVTAEPLLAMRSNERAGIRVDAPLPAAPRLLGQGPFAVILEFRHGPSATGVTARISRKNGGKLYEAACELEGADWTTGVLVLQTPSPVEPFSVSLERVRISGVLTSEAAVEEVPWRS